MRSGETKPSTRQVVFAGIALASVLILSTGCTSDLATGSGSGGSGSGASDNSDGKDKKTANGDNNDSPTSTLTGVECLPGDWLMDNSGIEAYMASVSGGASIKTSGDVTLTFRADGSAQTNYDRWTNNIKLDGARSVVERHGTDDNVYTASDSGTMTVSDTAIGSVTTMTNTTRGGEVIRMSIDPEPSVFSQNKFTCNGDTLTMVVDGYNIVLLREH